MRLLRSARWLLVVLPAACIGQAGPTPPANPGQSPSPQGTTFEADMVLPPANATTPAPVAVSTAVQPTFADVKPGTAPALPLSGGTLLMLQGGRQAVASDPDRDRIFVADLTTAAVIKEIALGPGDQPGRATQDAAGRVHVVLRGGGALASLAPSSWALERRPVCPAPRGIASSVDGATLYVACAGGELLAVPAAGGAPLWTRKLEPDLRDVVVDREGDLLVSTFRSARVLVVKHNGDPQPALALPTSLNLTRRTRAGREGPAATRFEPAVAWRTVAQPGGGALVLHQRGFTGEVEADSGTKSGSGGYGGSFECGGGIVQTVVSAVARGQVGKPAAELGGVLLGIDLALSADGATLAIASPADEHVRSLGSAIVLAPVASATAPSDHGCLLTGWSWLGPVAEPGVEPPWVEGERRFPLSNRLRGQAVAVGFDAEGDVVVQMREPAELRVPRRGVRIALSSEVRADVGHAVFHSNTGAGIACASCHPEGGEDGRTWRFVNLGPRRTQSLRGGLSDTLPLHWDGDMRDVAHIAREVFTGRMGGPVLASGETEALVKWLDQIPVLPASPAADPAAVARGQALFADPGVGCASCHAGPRLTNNQTVDVGTGRLMQVPSLLGLGGRAPYMHTGCAPNLTARFSPGCGGGERHGRTGHLSPAQAADLTSYLESL